MPDDIKSLFEDPVVPDISFEEFLKLRLIDWNNIIGYQKPENNANKREIFAQNSAPTGGYKEGDLWFDTDDNNKVYRADSALSWVSVKDGTIAGKITTFVQATVPTALAAGDLWFDSDDTYKPYRATNAGDDQVVAGEWVAINFADIGATVGATFGTNIAGGGTNNLQCGNDGYITYLRTFAFGTGADGDVVISSNTNLTSDMNYDDLTINAGVYLDTKNFKIRVKGTLTGPGKIINSGVVGTDGGDATTAPAAGAGGAGGVGVSGGSLPPQVSGSAGGNGADAPPDTGDAGTIGADSAKALAGAGAAGGAGGTVSGGTAGGAAGGAGSATGTVFNYPYDYANAAALLDTQPSLATLTIAAGAGGGGGGGSLNTNLRGGGGGGGGASGGIVWIAAQTIANGLNVEAKGGAGGSGGDAGVPGNYQGGSGGGGAGGSGGIVIIIYASIGTYSINVDGGAGGEGDSLPGYPGADGSAGGTGSSYLIAI